ncbi:hypothetical protein F4811DRAFT_554344 [Daldinia bambusicola]|nr:hypothetical protein F4811DRAFT_554344 [Daldinia bambusicola]
MEETLKQLEEELSSDAESREFDKDDTKASLPYGPNNNNTSSSRGFELGQCDDEERNATSNTPSMHAEPACKDRAKKERLKEHLMEALLYKKSWKFVMFQDDFLRTRTERADQAFAALLYGGSPLAKLVRWIFKTKAYMSSKAGNENMDVSFLRTGRIEIFQKGFLAIVSGLVLMIPVGILLLQPMDRWKSLAVVVCFGAAFIGVMLLLDKKLDKMLIGFSAYSAVLVTYDHAGVAANAQGRRMRAKKRVER